MRSGSSSQKAGLAFANNVHLDILKSSGGEGPANIIEAYLEGQRQTGNKERTGNEADVLLVLDDGVIPAHAAILSGSSPFFNSIFEMQGFILSPIREILMPEFPLRIMRKVIGLLYNDHVYLKSEKEAEEVRNLLSCLGINLHSKLHSSKLAKYCTRAVIDEVKVLPKSTKVEIFGQAVVLSSVEGPSGEEVSSSIKGPKSPLRSVTTLVKSPKCLLKSPNFARRTPKSSTVLPVRVQRGKVFELEDTSASESESVAESDSDYSDSDIFCDDSKSQSMKNNSLKVDTAKLAKGNTVATKPVSILVENLMPGILTKINRRISEGNKRLAIPNVPIKLEKSLDDSDTSTDYDADEDRFKNREWFLSEAKRCQKCKMDHETPAVASGCLTGHSRLRCYFCFRVVKTTQMLFNHFQRAHKQAKKENFVMCAICNQSIPFRAVSCHVISLHLTNPESSKTVKANMGTQRPTSTDLPPTKRAKLPEQTQTVKSNYLKVGNLDCTIRRMKTNGKTWVFTLHRNRH